MLKMPILTCGRIFFGFWNTEKSKNLRRGFFWFFFFSPRSRSRIFYDSSLVFSLAFSPTQALEMAFSTMSKETRKDEITSPQPITLTTIDTLKT
jgi:hypothetical protein